METKIIEEKTIFITYSRLDIFRVASYVEQRVSNLYFL